MKKTTKTTIITTLLLVVLATMFIIPSIIAPHINIGPNYINVTIWTKLNITHSKPQVLNVTIYEATNYSAFNITVTAGDTKKIYCNATVRDFNGFTDIGPVNATLYHFYNSSHAAADDNNTHYTNSSCTWNGSLVAGAPFTGWFVCSFDVYYFANNGQWRCNVTASNSYTPTNRNFTGSGYGNTTFYPVYALNITDGIDYGAIAVEETSGNRTANITNIGNMNINITVESYGAKRNDTLAMNCTLFGNISADNERFSVNPALNYDLKTPLSRTSQVTIPGLTILKQNISGPAGLMVNTTYWQIHANNTNNPAGNCTGYIIFTAVAP